jgi:hypothetical protein
MEPVLGWRSLPDSDDFFVGLGYESPVVLRYVVCARVVGGPYLELFFQKVFGIMRYAVHHVSSDSVHVGLSAGEPLVCNSSMYE